MRGGAPDARLPASVMERYEMDEGRSGHGAVAEGGVGVAAASGSVWRRTSLLPTVMSLAVAFPWCYDACTMAGEVRTVR